MIKVNNRIDSEEFKRQEFIGDAVYALVASEAICKKAATRNTDRALFYEVQSNKFMAEIAKKIKLELWAQNESAYTTKRWANALEVYVYELYMENGLEAVKEWFNNTIIPEIKQLKNLD